jgi:hypothetical protein
LDFTQKQLLAQYSEGKPTVANAMTPAFQRNAQCGTGWNNEWTLQDFWRGRKKA